MISEKVLSEILNKKVFDIIQTTRGEIEVGFSTKEKQYNFINIHEVVHECKEWLVRKDLMITIYYHIDTVAVSIMYNGEKYSSEQMSVLTESEAIFKACEWVLEQQEK